jgi:hypothetical protein
MSYKRIDGHEKGMDTANPDIAMAVDLTKEFLKKAKAKTEAGNIRLVVLLIPSRETVYYQYLLDKDYQLPEGYHRMVRCEQHVVDEVRQYCESLGILQVNARPGLEEALRTCGHLYPVCDNGHPRETGYAIYAKTVYDGINRESGKAKP